MPAVSQPSGKGIADDEDEHRGDGREREDGGEDRGGNVETLPGGATGGMFRCYPPPGPIEIV